MVVDNEGLLYRNITIFTDRYHRRNDPQVVDIK